MNFTGRYRDFIQPEKLHVLSISTLLDKLENSRGGIGANIAYGLAQLGEKPVLVGSVGQDAETYIADLQAMGVDTSLVHYSDLPTASFNVITDSEDNQVGGFYQGAMSDSESVSFKPWQGQDIVAMVCANNPEAMNRQVEECQQFGFRLVYDPGQQVTWPTIDLAAGIAAAEVLFVNDYELGLVCKKLNTTPEALKQQVPILVTTLGRDGSVIEGSKLNEPIKIGVAQVDLVDPTGAGDAYRAGFMYGYLRGWELNQCGHLGATLASFVIEGHGTQQSFTKEAVAKRYKDNFNEEITL
jgi:adenosine kinase